MPLIIRDFPPLPPAGRVAQCGTDGGYYRHRRTLGEDACDACKRAHAAAEQARLIRTGAKPRPRRPKATVAQCGTDGGYFRHLRTKGEAACDPCKHAHATAEQLRAVRRAQNTPTMTKKVA